MPYTIDEPDDAGKKEVPDSGRLFLGSEFEGMEIEYAVKILGEAEEEDEE